MVANLLTMSNAVCGFVAIVLVGCGAKPDEQCHLELKMAAWLIIFGMIFDVLDGRVARSTKTTSDLGAQLDSLADLVTFGVAPAVLVFRMHQILPEWNMWRWLLWGLSLAYFLGAVLRLARFTAETGPEEADHLCFKGLPSPGAAGVIASWVVFYFYLQQFEKPELKWLVKTFGEGVQTQLTAFADWIPFFLPFVASIVGYAMVSTQLRYVHVAGKLVTRRTFDAFVYVTFGILLLVVFTEIILPCLFFAYLISAPILLVFDKIRGRKARSSADPE